jgi:hypothetical protein
MGNSSAESFRIEPERKTVVRLDGPGRVQRGREAGGAGALAVAGMRKKTYWVESA